MGRGWGYNKGGGYSPSAYWQYWDGTWSAAQKRNSKGGSWKGKAEPSAPHFPAYDARGQETATPKGGKGLGEYQDAWAVEAAEPVEDMVTQVQSQINYTRKTEAKVRSLEAAKAKKEAMWGKYFEELKKAYVRELSRYQKAMSKIEQDLTTATTTRDEARRALQQFDFRTLGEEDSQATEALATEWHALTASWQREQEATNDQAILQRSRQLLPPLQSAPGMGQAAAMGALNGAMMTPDVAARLLLATLAGQPMTGQPVPGPAPAHPPAATAEGKAAEQIDKPEGTATKHPEHGPEVAPPYVASPSTRLGEAPSPSATKPPPRPRQRLPVKGQAIHPVHTQVPTTLSDKLNAKRGVLQPFGRPSGENAAPLNTHAMKQEMPGHPAPTDIEVDMTAEDDTDDEPPPIPPGPTLDGLG